jgi:UDP-N-acetylglucosamine--N-acetylmuramyl-(pentapeptide) pyrophosphoryl-undecaprenol N-acetylglucosamine transferase
MENTIALVGGGTAGHIWPTIEVGKVLRKLRPEVKIIYLGGKGSQEEKIAKDENFDFFYISAAKWDRFLSLRNVLTPFKILKGIFDARRVLKENKVNVLFAKGGFVSFPVVIAASSLKIPILGHESDSAMGQTNYLLLRFMKKMATAFPTGLYPEKIRKKLIYSGIPLREEFYHIDIRKAKKDFEILDNLPVLVVTGGSQGALAINRLIWEMLDVLLDNCQIIHLTGEKSFKMAQNIREKLSKEQKKRYKIFDYSFRMAEILSLADLVISRAGANTLFELAYLKKPTILIPYPYAAQNHQEKNAFFVKSLGGAQVFLERNLDEKIFFETILYFLNHKEEAQAMAKRMQALYVKNSAKIIAREILSLL